MTPKKLGLFAAAGMFLTSVSVWSLTPPGGFHSTPTIASATEESAATTTATDKTDLARFSTGTTLTMEGRVGHPKLFRAGDGSDFLMVEVKGASAEKSKSTAAVNLSIVIDRSGSMRGARIRNAIAAATTAVDRLNDGDFVSV